MVANRLVSRIGASPLWRAGLASVSILGLAGVAAGVLPEACRSGVFACGVSSEMPLELVAEAPEPAPLSSSSSSSSATGAAGDADTTSVPPAAMPVTAHDPAGIAGNDLVAATFSALESGLAVPAGALDAREVKTVAIGADGQPVSASETASSAAPDVSRAVEPATSSVVEQPSRTPVRTASAEPSSADVGAVGYAPQRGGTALVTGQGANVRAKPQKGGSEVLFALAGGAEVTVVEMREGWAKVVDARGRSGWMYGDYLRR